MRLYLDTNILVFFIYDTDELSSDVRMLLHDYANTLLTSTVCVQELIYLVQAGKVGRTVNGKHQPVRPETVLGEIEDAGIAIVPADTRHLATLAELPLHDDHHDPNDRLIIAQAIADRVPLVSSDRKFSRYARHGLRFIYNER